MSHVIILHGNVPSKKNGKRRIQRGANLFMVPSANHEAWHKEQMRYLEIWKRTLEWKEPLELVKQISIGFTPQNRRSADLSNKAESIMDLLVDAGILKDDNWFVVPRLHLTVGAVDKNDPTAHIIIEV